MKITEVQIKKLDGTSKIKALASITIDNALVVHEFKIVEGKNGLFVAMPSKKVGDTYVDISHPITAQSRSELFETVLDRYHQMV